MNEKPLLGKLTHRDLLYEALLLVMSKMDVSVVETRFYDLYWELKSRLEEGEELCDKCREKHPASDMVEQ